jgi:adenylate kinase
MLGENKSGKSSAAQGPVVVIFLGPPGCGKGTQSRELSRTIGLAHVSTGELLRRAAREGSALGQMVHGK